MAREKGKTSYGSDDSMSAKKPNRRFEDKRIEHVSVETKNVERAYDDLYKAFTSTADKQTKYYAKSTKGMADITISTQSRVYDQLNKMHATYIEGYVASESIAARRVVANSLSTHNMMYDHLERMHSDYLDTYIKNEALAAKRVADIWSGVSRSDDSGFARSANSDAYNASLSKMFDDIEEQTKSLSSSINDINSSIFDAMKSIDSSLKNKTSKYTSTTASSKSVTTNTSSGDNIPDVDPDALSSVTDVFSKLFTGNTVARNKMTEELTSISKKYNTALAILSPIKDAVISIASTFIKDYRDGIYNYFDAYEQSFTGIATRMNKSYNETRQYYKDMKDTVHGDLSSVININENLIPAMSRVAEQGLLREDAQAKAFGDALASVIMPWLETNTEAFINLSANMSDQGMKQFKGQQLLLQNTQSGNRLLQTGVINELTNEMAPLLTSIDYNTGGSNNLSAEYTAIMEQLVDQGMSERDAYAQVQKLINADKNLYQAVTSGDTSTVMYAQRRISGEDVIGAYSESINRIAEMAKNSGSDLNASAIMSTLGIEGAGGWSTQSTAEQIMIDPSSVRGILKDNTTNIEQAYEEAISNATGKLTATQKQINKANNATAKSNTADAITAVAHGNSILESIETAVKAIATYLIGNTIVKMFTKGQSIPDVLKNFLGKGGSTAPAGTGGSTGGILSKAGGAIKGKLATAGAVNLTGAAAGVGLGIYNGVSAYNNFKEGDNFGGAVNTVGALAGAGGAIALAASNPIGWVALAVSGLAIGVDAIHDHYEALSYSAKNIKKVGKIVSNQYDEMKYVAEQETDTKLKSLQDVKNAIREGRNLDYVRNQLIETGLLTEEDINKARTANLQSLEALTDSYISNTRKMGEDTQKALDKFSDIETEEFATNVIDLQNWLEDNKNKKGAVDEMELLADTIYGQLRQQENLNEKQQSFVDHYLEDKADGDGFTRAELEALFDRDGKNATSLSDLGINEESLSKLARSEYADTYGVDDYINLDNDITAAISSLASAREEDIPALMEAISSNYGIDFSKSNSYTSVAEDILKDRGLSNYMNPYKITSIGDLRMDYYKDKTVDGSHALGLDYVPFDNYVAELHKGERVLTAEENKNYRASMMDHYSTSKSKISGFFESMRPNNNRQNEKSKDSDAIVSALKEVSSEIIKAIRETSNNRDTRQDSRMLPRVSPSYNQSMVSLASTL